LDEDSPEKVVIDLLKHKVFVESGARMLAEVEVYGSESNPGLTVVPIPSSGNKLSEALLSLICSRQDSLESSEITEH